MMGRGALLSFLLHLLVALLIYFGVPSLRRPPLDLSQPIPVQIAPVADITQAPKPVPVPKKDPKPAPKKPDPKPEPKPEPIPEKAPEPEPVPEPKPEPVPEPKPEPIPEPAPVPEPKKPEPKPEPLPEKKPEKKPEPKKDKPKPKKEKPKVEKKPEKKKPKKTMDDLFESVLKDLSEPKNQDEAEEKDNKDKSEAVSDQVGALSDTVTISEMDAVRQKITQCWNIPAGAKEGHELVVEIRLWMNPDGTVQQAKILDPASPSRNPFYRTAAEAAMRAVKDPKCQPLPLPKQKYNEWKVFVVAFNPKDLL